MRKLLAFILAFALSLSASQITGVIQNPDGTPVANGTITFLLSQPAVLTDASATLATNSVSCYTDATGNVVGLPNPLVAPIGSNAGGGSLTPGNTYFLKIIYFNASGVTLASPELAFVIGGGSSAILVTAPALQPANATGYKIYASTTTGTETLQTTVTGFGTSTLTSIVSGAALPASNTVQCTIAGNDSMIPSFTYYNVNVVDANGQVSGFPQRYYIQGTPVNLAVLIPLGSTVARFPQPVVQQPNASAQQTINGPLNLGTFGLTAGTVTAGTVTAATLNNRIYVDGVKYALTAAGIQSAINDANTNGSREVWLPCGTININATINIFHGGTKLIGCGTGKNDVNTLPATLLIWTGGAGVQEMINICGKQTTDCTGGSTQRIDGVELTDMILDGNNSVNYTVRVEKTDTSTFSTVRVRQGLTASFYAVDSTGIGMWQFGCGVSASYCIVMDWGTGGFTYIKGQLENDLNSSNPLMLLQGNSNNLEINGVEMDATNATFGGYIQITGFDANSSFVGAPTGGAGAPNNVLFVNNSYVCKGGAGLPGQGANPGADVLVTGTAGHNSANIRFLADNITGCAGTSKFGWEFDQTNNDTLDKVTSSNHTVAGASTVNGTTNASTISMQYVTSPTDVARTTGAAAGVIQDIQQAPAGVLQNTNSGFLGQQFQFAETTTPGGAANVDKCYGDSTAHALECSYNNDAFAPLARKSQTLQVTGSNFTTSSGTLVAVTGLTFTAPASTASSWGFSCDLIYSQATAAAANLFGIITTQTAPTNLQVAGEVFTNNTGTQVDNNALITTATSTTVVTATPSAFGAIGTNADMFVAHIFGGLEAPSNGSPTQVAIAVATGNVGDALTIYRDASSCWWH